MIDEDCILQTLRSQLFTFFNVAYLYIYTSSCNRKKNRNSLKAVSNTVLVCWKATITEKTNKRGMQKIKRRSKR